MDALKSIGTAAAMSVTSSFLEQPAFDVAYKNDVRSVIS